MGTLSLGLRERILASYDHHEGTRDEVAVRYRVSLGMVKKLLQQRRRTGDIAPRHHCSGRKPTILSSHQHQMRTLLAQRPEQECSEGSSPVGSLSDSIASLLFLPFDRHAPPYLAGQLVDESDLTGVAS